VTKPRVSKRQKVTCAHPRLVVYGDVRTLTQGSTNSGRDDGSSGTGVSTKPGQVHCR